MDNKNFEVHNFEVRRKQLVEFMQMNGSLKSESIKNAFLKVKREIFMKGNEANAYVDSAFPIGYGQTISQPSTIAIMLEMLSAQPGMKVLEVGSGCGYVLALLSEIVGQKGQVFGIEIVPELKPIAERNLKEIGAKNVEIFSGDGSLGLPEKAPFDRIIVSAACPYLPKPLFEQLKENGTAVAPIGDAYSQVMTKITKSKGKMLKEEYLGTLFVFVPLRGAYGFK